MRDFFFSRFGAAMFKALGMVVIRRYIPIPCDTDPPGGPPPAGAMTAIIALVSSTVDEAESAHSTRTCIVIMSKHGYVFTGR